MNVTVNGGFSEVLERTKNALKDQGFGVLSEIDVSANLREKLGTEIEPYTILGVCNACLAKAAIEAEPAVGVFLPCTVVVRQNGGHVVVHAQDPALADAIIGNDDLIPISSAARQGILAALDQVSAMNAQLR